MTTEREPSMAENIATYVTSKRRYRRVKPKATPATATTTRKRTK